MVLLQWLEYDVKVLDSNTGPPLYSDAHIRFLTLANCDGREHVRKHGSKSFRMHPGYLLLSLLRSGVQENHTASYFSHANVEATKLRDQLAADSLDMLIQWLKEGGNVGILGTCTR
jgi:hypothetical protein